MDEKYYVSLIERMIELLKDFDNAPNDDLINVAQSINVDSLYNIPLKSHIALYRARYRNGFDDTDLNQFSYIHNVDIIQQLRYNKANEPVLYTATNPVTAYKEIESPEKSGPFYLSVWRPEAELVYSFLFDPHNCKSGTNAEKLTGIFSKKLEQSPVGYDYLDKIGQLMEHDGTNYYFSSELASEIFKSIDALVSVSAKSNGSELNITFSKNAADKAVRMCYVLFCEKMENQFFYVQKIGLLEGNSVVWYDFQLDDTSYKRESFANEKTDDLWKWTKQNPSKINPVFVNKIEGDKVYMLAGGSEMPVFSYNYTLCKQ